MFILSSNVKAAIRQVATAKFSYIFIILCECGSFKNVNMNFYCHYVEILSLVIRDCTSFYKRCHFRIILVSEEKGQAVSL